MHSGKDLSKRFEKETILWWEHSWVAPMHGDKDMKKRVPIQSVLIEKEDDIEAPEHWLMWKCGSENFKVASDYLKIALGYPTSEDLMLRKARLQLRLILKKAHLLLSQDFGFESRNKEALKMLNSMKDSRLSNKFQLSFNTDFLTRTPPRSFCIRD